ncbi:hypothetical protein [Domibacillus sp. A3M-37]|uniref:DUF6980 family protein n=1 Tax=Domibacillus sp. A3M-37 TaxID=2962037 RepID=UPI0035BEC357
MKMYYCEDIEYHSTFNCDIHEKPFDCPDQLTNFFYKKRTNEQWQVLNQIRFSVHIL